MLVFELDLRPARIQELITLRNSTDSSQSYEIEIAQQKERQKQAVGERPDPCENLPCWPERCMGRNPYNRITQG